MILIPGEPKHHCDPPVRVGAYGGQVISGVVAQVHVTVGSVYPRIHPVVIFSSSMMRNWKRRIQQLGESPHLFFLDLLIHSAFISLPSSLPILLLSPLPFCLPCPCVSMTMGTTPLPQLKKLF